MEWLKRIMVQLAIGANVMAALLLLACGLSSEVNPAVHPRLALFGLGFPLLLLLGKDKTSTHAVFPEIVRKAGLCVLFILQCLCGDRARPSPQGG